MHKISIQSLLVIVISFVLIAVFAPMAFIVFEENNQINLLRQEKIGAMIIPKIQNINILLAQHRGTANRFLNGNHDVMPQLDDLNKKIDEAFVQGIAECNAQPVTLPCEQLANLNQKWLTFQTRYLALSAQGSFNQHSLLIMEMLSFLTNVADSSNLSLDNQLSTYYLTNSMVEKIPDLVERIGKLRGFASGVIVSKHQMTTGEQIDIVKLIDGIRSSMQAVNTQMNKIFSLLPVLQEAQQNNLMDINHKAESFLSTIDEQIIYIQNEHNDQVFYDQATDLISQFMQIYTPIVERLDQELDKRIGVLLFERYCILIGAFLLASLLIGFLLHFKKRLDVLNQAIHCFEQFGSENYEYTIEIKYHDEIGKVLTALNLMRNRLAKNAEQIKQNISRLTEAQRIAQLGDWEWDVQTDELHCSAEAYRILEIKENTSTWNFERFLDQIKTTDRDNVAATFDRAKKVPGNYDVEYQTQCKTGEKKIIHQRIESYTNENDEAIHIIGTVQDVTLQYEMEARIRLAAEVFDHIGEAIMVTDEDNKVMLINNVFNQITGYTENDILGRNPNLLSSGKQDAHFYKTMWEDINTRGFWKGEVWNNRKNGEPYPEMLTITTIRNSIGEIVNHIGIFSDISIQKRAAEQLEFLALHDSLTMLMNRTSLKVAVDLALEKAQKNNLGLALLFIDLDGFKAVNDNLGHDVGDTVLKNTAERLRESVRERDIVARLGGDEFVVVLTDLTEKAHIATIAEKIVTSLNQVLTNETKTLYISPSIGIAVYSESCNDYEKLILNADKAMYAVKTQGKNNFQFAEI